jgi:hypothetical protein
MFKVYALKGLLHNVLPPEFVLLSIKILDSSSIFTDLTVNNNAVTVASRCLWGELVWSISFTLHTNTDMSNPPSLFSQLPTSTYKMQGLGFDVLHILPTLVNLQGDDQLNWTYYTPSLLGAEDDRPRFPVSFYSP